MILSYNWKIISERANHSHIVTSHKISENEMGNRGSKSNYVKFVKEQRVDGSWFTGPCTVDLRYTLRGFERITWTGIPSKQILSKQLYSTTNNSKNLIKPKLSTINGG